MLHRSALLALACGLSLLSHAAQAQTNAAAASTSAPAREQVGNRTTEYVPAIPGTLIEQLNRYQNTRGALFAGWTQDGCVLIGTRFAETAQAHRVCQPLGMREQLTFYPEPLSSLQVAPTGSSSDGFVFGKDKGGNEFWQLYWFDLKSRQTTLLTDGKSRNSDPLLSHDGRQLAFTSTARNGKDSDVWLMDLATRKARALVTNGGQWNAVDFSPDGKKLLVIQYVSVNEAYPGEVDLASGKLKLFPVDGGKASFGEFRYVDGGKSVLFVSDEPVKGQAQEFRTLRYHNPATGELKLISGLIPWDVDALEVSRDGKRVAYVSNEDGIDKLHVLAWPSLQEQAVPALPVGVVGGLGFSPDGGKLAVTLNTATSPSDVQVIDLQANTLTRWTRSEVGGLDSSTFVAPTLVRYPTFDEVDGKPRTIPAFYYQPRKPAAGGKTPVIISIHGGPEGQSLPTFNATTQFLVNELGVAVLVPNVRGSTGYGKTYVQMDNGFKREDSVKDIGALLDWIAKQPELDAKRVGVMGGSYGGYMVLASLMHYSDRIRAGIDIVGISHFGTFLKNTESYRRDLRRAEYGDERDPEMAAHFEKISPLNGAKRITSPLFVAQGRNDPRVPYTEAEQIVKAVRSNGQPVWYLEFSDEGHGFQKKSNSDYFGAASMVFWQQHLLK